MQSWASEFYRSAAWLACRRAYITRRVGIDGGLCERCRRRPGKIVHHRQHLTRETIGNPAVTLAADNLELLCQFCHNEEHLGRAAAPLCRFDAWGNPLPPSGR